MTRSDLKEPARLKRLMPGLRRLALFPRKSIAIVSFETGIELVDLVAYCKFFGRPDSGAIQKLEQLDAEETRTPVSVVIPLVSEPEQKPEPSPRDPSPLEIKCRAICVELLDDRNLTEAAVCKRFGVLGGSWCYFKKKNFGLGPISATKLAAFLGMPVPAEKPSAPLPTERECGTLEIGSVLEPMYIGVERQVSVTLSGGRVLDITLRFNERAAVL